MKGKLILGCGLVVMAVVVGLLAAGIGSAEATEGVAPEEVVTRFYEGYVGSDGESETTRNLLADRAYRSSEFLSDGFIDEVDALLDSFERGGYNPFLLAQDVPTSVEVGEAMILGATAAVPVETSRGARAAGYPGADGWRVEDRRRSLGARDGCEGLLRVVPQRIQAGW